MTYRSDSPGQIFRRDAVTPVSTMLWRSLLFVPVLQARFVQKAHERGADAIVLDLEDSIPQSDKISARTALPDAIDALAAKDVPVLVRINRNWRDAVADMEAAVRPGVRAIVLPKVSEPGAMRVVCEILSALEKERGITAGTVGLVPMIEDAGALRCAADIALAGPRVRAITLGAEDYALSAGCCTGDEALLAPSAAIVQAAAVAGVVALGLVGTIADFSDIERFRSRVRRSRDLGFRGSLLIHPLQVQVANKEFSATQAELDWARRIADAGSQEHGAFQIDGQMIDLPILLRARRLLAEAAAVGNMGRPPSGEASHDFAQ